MDQDSLFKRTLVLTGTMAGISALWMAVVSLVLMIVTDRAVAGWQGSRGATTTSSTTSAPSKGGGSTDAPAAPRSMFNPATPVAGPKPNG